MFKLYKINDHANLPYYSTGNSTLIGECDEVDVAIIHTYVIKSINDFCDAMRAHCTYRPYGIGFVEQSLFEVDSDYVCVIEFMNMDMDEPCVQYEVVEQFYSENDCNAGIIYNLPYVLHFVEL